MRDEEEEHGLAEVADDGDHCKRHVSLPLPILIIICTIIQPSR